ncbi:MAG: acyltransferase [Halobacteriovoraceae bacterium]|jgi:peptidoglycan/LPS O-acetylase OafA/YrhL|nr:acyltransferase [Halobacteriovoraceae bacterium]
MMNSFFKIDDGKERDYGLDLMRAIAIIGVMFYHFPKEQHNILLRAFSQLSYLGVDIFFVLSGYLIGGQVLSRLAAGKNFSFKAFCTRRFLRTLPNYYLILACYMLFYGLENFDWRYLVFLQNIGGLLHFSHSWSLCVEEHFYIIFPIYIMVLVKFNKIKKFPYLIFGAILCAIALRSYNWLHFRPDLVYLEDYSKGFALYFEHIFYPTYTRLDSIAIGTLLAYAKFFKPRVWERLIAKPNYTLLLSAILFLLTAALSWTKVKFFASTLSFTFYAISFALLLISLTSPTCYLNKKRIPFIKSISILSYSLYLTHSFAFLGAVKIANYFGSPGNSWLSWSLLYPCSFILAYVLYILVEKPVLEFRKKLLWPGQ